MRRGLNILHGASKQEIEDLFSTSSEVEKMNGMVQTLQIMVGAIEARKAVVAEREAARLAAAAAPAVQRNLTAFFQAPTPSVQVTSISEDEPTQVDVPAPKKRGRPKGKKTCKELPDDATERRVSSRSSASTSASSYVESDLRRSVRIEEMDEEPCYPAVNVDDSATKAARAKMRRKAKAEARQQLDKARQATAMEDLQLLYETLAKEVDNTLDDAALSRSDKALRGAIMGVLRFLASSDRPTTRAKAYELAALYSNFSERTVRRHFQCGSPYLAYWNWPFSAGWMPRFP